MEKSKALNTLKTPQKTTKRLLTLQELKQTIVNNRGSTVLDYNAVTNDVPKTWLDWISANKQATELEI